MLNCGFAPVFVLSAGQVFHTHVPLSLISVRGRGR